MVVGVAGEVSQELYDVVGHQRGWEILAAGVDDPRLVLPPFVDFALALAAESVELAQAPPLPTSARPEVVVTDPHYNTLVSHEIVGHPVELDRALKMETAYAGRSWLMAGLDDHHVGRRIASPLVSAYSDPALPGYGHYAYDHEGTPARRVLHIDRGVLVGFMNSRQTAAVLGGAPNGHFKATDASLVPLIRMSNTVFAAGDRDAADIVKEVDRGWYLAGHRIPSIAESRENFRISARKVDEIRDGRLGRLYRDGGIMADTREYLMNVDAVGSDLSALSDSQLRQGTADADQEARQRRTDDAQPRTPGRRLSVRRLVMTLVTGSVLLLGAAPAAPPDAPVTFIKADELKALQDRWHTEATSSTSAPGTPTRRCTSRARARCPCAPSSPGPARSPRPASSSSTEPARTPWPGGPATSSTRSAGAITASSTKAYPAGTPRATPCKAPPSPRTRATRAAR